MTTHQTNNENDRNEEWLVNQFKAYQPTEPSEQVLQHVRKMAEKEMRRSVKANASAWNFFSMPRFALSFSVLVVLGVSVATYFFSQDQIHTKTNLTAAVQDESSMDLKKELSESLTNGSLETKSWADSQFLKAKEHFANGEFTQSHDLFSEITAKVPSFEKNQELYQIWVATLQKMGKFELAEQKKVLLEKMVQ